MNTGTTPISEKENVLSSWSPSMCQIEGQALQSHYKKLRPKAGDCSIEYVRHPFDRSVLIDHKGRPVSVDRMLATKPLKSELSQRPGPGNRKLLYLSGEGVTRTLNDIFGFDGWNLNIQKTEKTVCEKNGERWQVAYTALVRITHCRSGTYKEDMGAGDAIDRSLATAVQHALKASITDALKRAARHFGDKLGNSLYMENFQLHKAPKTLAEALDQYDQERAQKKFGEITSEHFSDLSICDGAIMREDAPSSMPPPQLPEDRGDSVKSSIPYRVQNVAASNPAVPMEETRSNIPVSTVATAISPSVSVLTEHNAKIISTSAPYPPPTAAQGLMQNMFQEEPSGSSLPARPQTSTGRKPAPLPNDYSSGQKRMIPNIDEVPPSKRQNRNPYAIS